MTSFERIMVVVCAVVAALLQVFLAPHIVVFAALPNFLAVACLVVAVSWPQGYGPVLPFVLGLLFDLISGGPVGAMAFSLTAFSVATAWFYQRANNDTKFMALVVLAGGLLLVEVSYGVFCLLFGYSAGAFEAFVYRTLPCFLYDLVIALVVYLATRRLFKRGDPLRPEITQLQ